MKYLRLEEVDAVGAAFFDDDAYLSLLEIAFSGIGKMIDSSS